MWSLYRVNPHWCLWARYTALFLLSYEYFTEMFWAVKVEVIMVDNHLVLSSYLPLCTYKVKCFPSSHSIYKIIGHLLLYSWHKYWIHFRYLFVINWLIGNTGSSIKYINSLWTVNSDTFFPSKRFKLTCTSRPHSVIVLQKHYSIYLIHFYSHLKCQPNVSNPPLTIQIVSLLLDWDTWLWNEVALDSFPVP